MPVSPQTFFNFAADHSSLLMKLHDRGEVDAASLQALIAACSSSESPREERTRTLLLDYGFLEAIPGAESIYELTQPLKDLLGWLRRSQHLSSATVLKGYLSELEQGGRQIDQALQKGDLSIALLALQDAEGLMERLRALSSANREAITHRALALKSTETSVIQRFIAVSHLWEHHLIPLRELVSIDGPMDQQLSELADIFQAAEERFVAHPAARRFDGARARLVRLRVSAAEDHLVAMREIAPLYDRLRRDSGWVQGATAALQKIRSEGIATSGLKEKMALAGSQDRGRLSDDRLSARFAALSDYQPQPPPPIEDAEPLHIQPMIPRAQIQEALKHSGPLPDLLAWLLQCWPEASLAAILDAYTFLQSRPGLEAHGEARDYIHREATLYAYPHQIR